VSELGSEPTGRHPRTTTTSGFCGTDVVPAHFDLGLSPPAKRAYGLDSTSGIGARTNPAPPVGLAVVLQPAG
jgi:hypothetical protein